MSLWVPVAKPESAGVSTGPVVAAVDSNAAGGAPESAAAPAALMSLAR